MFADRTQCLQTKLSVCRPISAFADQTQCLQIELSVWPDSEREGLQTEVSVRKPNTYRTFNYSDMPYISYNEMWRPSWRSSSSSLMSLRASLLTAYIPGLTYGYFLVWQMADWSPVTLCQIWSQLKQFRCVSPRAFVLLFIAECFIYFIHLLSGFSGETVSVGVLKPWWTVCSLSLYPFL